jgi:hypothetical protein
MTHTDVAAYDAAALVGPHDLDWPYRDIARFGYYIHQFRYSFTAKLDTECR